MKEALKLSLQYDNENGVVRPQSWTKKLLVTCGLGNWGKVTSHCAWEIRKLLVSLDVQDLTVKMWQHFLKIWGYLCQDTTLQLLKSKTLMRLATPLIVFLPKLSVQRQSNKWGEWLQWWEGTNVTMIVATLAIGNHAPPVLILPTVHFKNHMLTGAPTASLGGANPTG